MRKGLKGRTNGHVIVFQRWKLFSAHEGQKPDSLIRLSLPIHLRRHYYMVHLPQATQLVCYDTPLNPDHVYLPFTRTVDYITMG